ncbi:MAG: hypothetical protein ACRC8Q_10840 [Aeromonas sp.]
MNMTQMRYEVLFSLYKPGRYLLSRRSTKLSIYDKPYCLSGSNVIEVVGGAERFIKRASWHSTVGLRREGLIARVGARPPEGELYEITELGRALFFDCYRMLKKGRADEPWYKKPRVRMPELVDFAAAHGCEIYKNVARKWYELRRIDGKELVLSVITEANDGAAVMRLGQISPEEWKEAIIRASRVKWDWE